MFFSIDTATNGGAIIERTNTLKGGYMDETSWRARLAKSNINILDAHDGYVFLEFTYHPRPGVFKWCKTMFPYDVCAGGDSITDELMDRVLTLRKELEG